MAFEPKIFLKKCWRILKKTLLIMFFSSAIYLIVCKWLMPPITITQVSNSFNYGLKRDYVNWNEISYNVKLAAIASEDQLFADHNGFDWDAIEKSFKPKKSKRNKKSKIPLGGGNIFLWQGGGYVRKLPEFYFTQLIEWTWGKKRILEVYLNTIEMGSGIFGIEAAAQQYFKKSAKNLTRKEAAMIIACLPNPKKFTVVPMSKRVAWRYPQIVHQMAMIEDDEDILQIIK
ncbi:MAG: monofunctional biosynthetic peptidoglycan transglycosylase [Chitinophagaceae bacterium]|nr:monofunctional biosynthetic peptidoglycan transglycosylase [Chitinophagaceae bacterium]